MVSNILSSLVSTLCAVLATLDMIWLEFSKSKSWAKCLLHPYENVYKYLCEMQNDSENL